MKNKLLIIISAIIVSGGIIFFVKYQKPDLTNSDAVKTRAEEKDAKAQNDLSTKLPSGEGMPKESYIRMIKIMAEKGDANAQNLLGVFYSKGDGIGRDDTEAVKWFRLAADQGLSEAKEALEQLRQ
jgi:TPR repeat protein